MRLEFLGIDCCAIHGRFPIGCRRLAAYYAHARRTTQMRANHPVILIENANAPIAASLELHDQFHLKLRAAAGEDKMTMNPPNFSVPVTIGK